MATQEQLRRLQAQAAEWEKKFIANLTQRLNVGNPRAFSHGLPRSGDRGFSSTQKGAGFQMQQGVMPNDLQIQQLIAAQGGNPYTKKFLALSQKAAANAPAPARTAGPPALGMASNRGNALRAQIAASNPLATQSQLDKLMADYEAKLAEANRQNQLRYDEGKRELTDVRGRGQAGYASGSQELAALRDRNAGRIGNWGLAQAQLNEEKAAEALGAQTANLAARGLGNSTILPAYQQRNARDLALVQQDLSERRDARFVDADTRDTGNLLNWNERGLAADARDTGNLVGFIERRNDTGPDPQMYMNLVQQLGQADAAQRAQANWERQFAEQQRQFDASQRLQRSLNQIPYGAYGGYGGQRGVPIQANLFGGGQPQRQLANGGWFNPANAVPSTLNQVPAYMTGGMPYAPPAAVPVTNAPDAALAARVARVAARRAAGYQPGDAQRAQLERGTFLYNQRHMPAPPPMPIPAAGWYTAAYNGR